MEIESLSDYTMSNLYVCRELVKMEPNEYPPSIVDELDSIMKPHLLGAYNDKKSYGYGYRVLGTWKKLINTNNTTLEALRFFVQSQLTAFVETYNLTELPKGLAKITGH